MPLMKVKGKSGKNGYKWGKSGKAYFGKNSRNKALQQMRAIKASGWVENAINPLRSDPTRTASIRRQFSSDVRRRFKYLKKAIYKLVVEEDALGLKESSHNPLINHSFSSTQINIDAPVVKKAVERLQELLDPNDVLEIEDKPHVTIRYGLHTDNGEGVDTLLEYNGPVWFKLGKLSIFTSDKQDVLKIAVSSQQLANMNRALGILPNTQTHRGYHPHLTIAYLKPGTGSKYLNNRTGLEGYEIVAKEFVFSNKNRQHTTIALNCGGEGGKPGPCPSKSDSEIARLHSTYPALKSLPDVVIYVEAGKVLSKDKSSIGGVAKPDEEIYGEYIHGGANTIRIADAADSGFGFEHGLRHEYGHHVQEHYERPIDPATGRKISWQNLVSRQLEHGPIFKDDYFNRSHKEVFAEAFAHYTSPDYKKGTLPKSIENYFGRVLGKPTINTRFKFHSLPEKISGFMNWLGAQIKYRILGNTVKQIEDNWWTQYAEDGYRKGAARAFDDFSSKATGKPGVGDFYEGTRDQFLRSSFGNPVQVEKVKVLAARTYSDLQGVTDAMRTNIQRELTDGLVQGQNPREVARNLNKVVDDIGIRRAELIACTETIRAHAQGQLDALENLGVEEVGVMVELSTAGDDRVCEACQDMEGTVLTIDEAQGIIPLHPDCRCAFIPANVGESKKGQKRSKNQIDKAIEDATEELGGEDSTWQGADTEISKQRPKSILDR